MEGLILLTRIKNSVRIILKSSATYSHRVGLTPNMITAIGFIAAVGSALCYGFKVGILISAVLYFLAGFFDVLDGTIASFFNETTVFGGFLDSLLDRYSDAAVIIGIIFGGFCSLGWGLAALVGTLLVSYARARGEAANIKMASIGLAERAERIIIILIASLLTVVYSSALLIGIAFLALVSHVTVVQRAYHIWESTKNDERITN